MNKTRIIGLVLFVGGLMANLTLKNESIDFISSFLMGFGAGALMAGRIGWRNA